MKRLFLQTDETEDWIHLGGIFCGLFLHPRGLQAKRLHPSSSKTILVNDPTFGCHPLPSLNKVPAQLEQTLFILRLTLHLLTNCLCPDMKLSRFLRSQWISLKQIHQHETLRRISHLPFKRDISVVCCMGMSKGATDTQCLLNVSKYLRVISPQGYRKRYIYPVLPSHNHLETPLTGSKSSQPVPEATRQGRQRISRLPKPMIAFQGTKLLWAISPCKPRHKLIVACQASSCLTALCTTILNWCQATPKGTVYLFETLFPFGLRNKNGLTSRARLGFHTITSLLTFIKYAPWYCSGQYSTVGGRQ